MINSNRNSSNIDYDFVYVEPDILNKHIVSNVS